MTCMKKVLLVAVLVPLTAALVLRARPGGQEPRPITPMDLMTLKDIGGVGGGRLSVSPDGNHAAFELHQADVAANGYRVDWFIAPTTPGGQAVHAGDAGDPELFKSVISDGRVNGAWISKPAKWSPDSRWIAYLKKENGEVQLWRSRADGQVQEQLTSGAGDVTDFAWADDGARILYAAGPSRSLRPSQLKEEAERGYLLDERFEPRHSFEPVYTCGGVLCSAEPADPDIRTYDFATKTSRPATEEERAHYQEDLGRPKLAAREQARSVLRARDGPPAVAWLENLRPEEFPGWGAHLTLFAAFSSDGKDPVQCGAAPCTGNLEPLGWSATGKEVYFLRREGANFGKRGLYVWRVGDSDVQTILQTDDLIEDCAIAGDRIVCLHEGAKTPRKLVLIDPADGSMDTLFDPNPEFRNIALSRVEKLEWKDAFGNDAFGHLVYPLNYEEGRRYPLVIVQYRSRGFLRGGVGDEYPIHLLAANGFAVLSFDRPEDRLRGASIADRFEREIKEWEDFYERRRALTALETVLDRLEEMGVIDPDRVGLTGLSDGAETVQFALIHSDRFKVAAASGLFWDPVVYHLSSERIRKFVRSLVLVPEGAGLEKWRGISLALNAEHIKAPLLVQVADHELIGSLQAFTSLQDAGKPVEMYLFPDEYHVKWHPKHRYNIYRRNVQWFNFWLRGVEDPDPVDPEQYERWREMRKQHEANQKKQSSPQEAVH